MEILIYLDTHVVIWLYTGNTENIPSKTLGLMKTSDITIQLNGYQRHDQQIPS